MPPFQGAHLERPRSHSLCCTGHTTLERDRVSDSRQHGPQRLHPCHREGGQHRARQPPGTAHTHCHCRPALSCGHKQHLDPCSAWFAAGHAAQGKPLPPGDKDIYMRPSLAGALSRGSVPPSYPAGKDPQDPEKVLVDGLDDDGHPARRAGGSTCIPGFTHAHCAACPGCSMPGSALTVPLLAGMFSAASNIVTAVIGAGVLSLVRTCHCCEGCTSRPMPRAELPMPCRPGAPHKWAG